MKTLIEIIKLLVFVTGSLIAGYWAFNYFIDIQSIAFFGSKLTWFGVLYTLPLGFSGRILSVLQRLIGHSALNSSENTAMGKIVKKTQRSVWLLIFLYMFSALSIIVVAVVPITVELLEVNKLFVVICIVTSVMSVLSIFRLVRIEFEVTDLLTELSTKEKLSKEKAAKREAALKALEMLENGTEFTKQEKARFKTARTVIPK